MKDPATNREHVPGVKKIAVLNPSAVGDFVVTLPALHALKAVYPDAQITYIGKQWHANFLKNRSGPIDDVVIVPPVPGVGAPPDIEADDSLREAFLQTMQAEHFDLAIQMYGGGGYSNAFINRFGARLTIGLKTRDAEPLDRWLPFVYLQNNRLRMLEVAGLVGANRLQLGQELEVMARDREEAAAVISAAMSRPLVVIHPGASDVRRHWPAERFAAVASTLAEEGAFIVVNGVEAEAGLVRQVMEQMRHPAIDLIGMSLSGLLGILERAALLISNDSGPLHLALAIGAPSVGIYWFSNLYSAGPLVHEKHRIALSTQTQCPVCGVENVNVRCPHDVSFVATVSVEEVMELSCDLLALHLGPH